MFGQSFPFLTSISKMLTSQIYWAFTSHLFYSLLKLMLVGLWLGTMNCLAVHGAGKQLYWGWVLAP
jgi:hypothetical protein